MNRHERRRGVKVRYVVGDHSTPEGRDLLDEGPACLAESVDRPGHRRLARAPRLDIPPSPLLTTRAEGVVVEDHLQVPTWMIIDAMLRLAPGGIARHVPRRRSRGSSTGLGSRSTPRCLGPRTPRRGGTAVHARPAQPWGRFDGRGGSLARFSKACIDPAGRWMARRT